MPVTDDNADCSERSAKCKRILTCGTVSLALAYGMTGHRSQTRFGRWQISTLQMAHADGPMAVDRLRLFAYPDHTTALSY